MKRILYTLLAAAVVLAISYFYSISTLEANMETPTLPAVMELTPIGVDESLPLPTVVPYTAAEAKQLAGFDVKEPSYLPAGVSFDYATYQKSPYTNVTLHYKFFDEILGDMGSFFQIVQEPQMDASPNPTACGVTDTDCEIVQIDNIFVQYRLTPPTESLMWNMDGFSFSLLRTAGEPNKIYKDELLKVAASMQQLSANPSGDSIGDPAINVSQARDIALLTLDDSFDYIEPLIVVKEAEMTYGEFSAFVSQTFDRPADMRVWVAIYFNEMWRYTPEIPASSIATSLPSFRGCVQVVIDLSNGSPVEVGGPVSENVLPECDT